MSEENDGLVASSSTLGGNGIGNELKLGKGIEVFSYLGMNMSTTIGLLGSQVWLTSSGYQFIIIVLDTGSTETTSAVRFTYWNKKRSRWDR